jgi:hypothetical protein
VGPGGPSFWKGSTTPKQPEGKLVQKIRKYVLSIGGRPFKIWGSDESPQEVGIPDLLICFRGLFVALEVKQPGKKASKRQDYVMQTIRDAGGIAVTVDSFAAVVELFERLQEWALLTDPVTRAISDL